LKEQAHAQTDEDAEQQRMSINESIKLLKEPHTSSTREATSQHHHTDSKHLKEQAHAQTDEDAEQQRMSINESIKLL